MQKHIIGLKILIFKTAGLQIRQNEEDRREEVGNEASRKLIIIYCNQKYETIYYQ